MLETSGIIDQGNPGGVPSQAPAPLALEYSRIERGLTTERPFMSDNHAAACNRDIRLENFAAELTSAAYPLALRQGMNDSWIKVELGLWWALTETVEKWAKDWPPAESSDDFKVWQEGFLVDLTESAFCIAVKHGIKGSRLRVELDLYRALRLVIRKRWRRQIAQARH
jgi:hypothetical protein